MDEKFGYACFSLFREGTDDGSDAAATATATATAAATATATSSSSEHGHITQVFSSVPQCALRRFFVLTAKPSPPLHNLDSGVKASLMEKVRLTTTATLLADMS